MTMKKICMIGLILCLTNVAAVFGVPRDTKLTVVSSFRNPVGPIALHISSKTGASLLAVWTGKDKDSNMIINPNDTETYTIEWDKTGKEKLEDLTVTASVFHLPLYFLPKDSSIEYDQILGSFSPGKCKSSYTYEELDPPLTIRGSLRFTAGDNQFFLNLEELE
jgi:hypothetical protein